VPQAFLRTLGLGLGFCLALHREKSNPIDSERLRRDLRIKYFVASQGLNDGGFNPKLYVKNSEWDPPNAPDIVEEAIDVFETRTSELFHHSRNLHHEPNLTSSELRALRAVKKENRFVVTATDKNLGPAVMESQLYIRRSLDDHLLNPRNYQELSMDAALTINTQNFRSILRQFVDDRKNTDAQSRLFFERKLFGLRDSYGVIQPPDSLQLPYFYILPKVHKTPWKSRPVVSCVSSVPEPLSVWIDYQLQRVVHLCPAYLQDSWHFLHTLQQQDPFPDDCCIFTADAVGMYANINTDHALEVMYLWFDLHAHDLPKDFPRTKISYGLDLIMRNNVFTFGNRYWIQKNGTAMGTSCACMYATIYYSYHEETELIPMNGVLFYRRLIDDAFVILRNPELNFAPFAANMKEYGPPDKRLDWEVMSPSRCVDFLDLTVRITPAGLITTRTFQKPMNLYLYRPPSSAQPPSILYGLIFGTLHRYFWQNSDRSDMEHFTNLFFERLQRRGHTAASLAPLFQKAASRVDTSSMPVPRLGPLGPQYNQAETFFLHLPFHPQDPSRMDIQQIFDETLRSALEDAPIGTNRMTIAYSRAPNIGDTVRRNRLPPTFNTFVPGSTPSPSH
jgi:hypothetical protein